MRTGMSRIAAGLTAFAALAVLPSQAESQAQQGTPANPNAGMFNPSHGNVAATAEFRAALDATVLWQWSEARARTRRALEIEPTFGAARALDAWLVSGAPAAADAQRAATEAATGTAAEAAFALGIRETIAGRPVPGRRFTAVAAESSPNDRRIAMWRAFLLADTARLNALRELNAKHPDFVPSRTNLAFYLTPVNDSAATANAEEALRVAGEAVTLAPDMSTTHTALGHVLHALKRDGEAQPHLVAATRMSPKSWYAYQVLAEIAALDGKPSDMRPLLDSATALSPNVSNIYNYRRARAMTYVAEGNLRQAMTDLESAARDAEAIGARGQANTTHLFMVSVAAQLGDTAGIEQHLVAARSFGAGSQGLHDYALSAHAFTGQASRARAAYDTLARLNAQNPNLSAAVNAGRERYMYRSRGWLLIAEKKPQEALAEFQLGDDNPYTTMGIVEALRMQKKTKDADAARAAFYARREFSYVSTAVPIMRYRALKK